jgi:hypothetical protein
MSHPALSNVNLIERMARTSRRGISSQTSSELDPLIYLMSQIALLGSDAGMLQETDKIFDALEIVLVEPERLLTACALSHSKNGRTEQAATMLEKVLGYKPEYEPAQVALAGVWVLQKKKGWVPVINKLLSTSLNPLVRRTCSKILESNPV